MQLFNFGEQQLRTLELDGELYFVLKDVCDVLELGQVAAVKRRLSEDVITNHPLETSGGKQNMTLINEDGLYDVILESRKQEAKAFRKWITSEVIPSIRKTGSYTAPNNVVPIDERRVRMELLKSVLEHDQRFEEVETRIISIEQKVEEQITLDSGAQRKVQKAIAKRIYDLVSDQAIRSEYFRQLHREIRDRWAVASYKDVRRQELHEVLRYIDAWKPRAA